MNSPKVIENEEFHSAIEFPWKKSFMSLMRPVVVEELVETTDYKFSGSLPGFIKKNWNTIKDLTLIDPFRLGWILDILVSVKNIKGDIVECGSFNE